MDAEDIAERDLAGLDIGAHAAAVDERDVGAGLGEISVCAEVAEVGLGPADHADGSAVVVHGLGIIDGQEHLAAGDDLLELLLQRAGGLGHIGRYLVGEAEQSRCGVAVVPGVEAGRDRAVDRDAAIADAGKLGAAGAAEHVLAVLVLHLDLVGVMAVAVEEDVDAAGVGDDVAVGPGMAFLFVAQVAHGDDVVDALRAGRVDGGLDGVVHALAAFVLEEAVDKLAVLILKVLRRGGGQGLGRGHADESDLRAAELTDHIGLEDQFALAVEVAADVVELGLLGQRKELIHAVVEFVVAGDGDAVAHLVHQIEQGLAFGHGADRLALDVVAVVDEDDVVALGGQIVADLGKAGVAEALVDAAVNVAREEDHHVGAALGIVGGAGHAAHKRAEHHKDQQEGQESLCHGFYLDS